MKACIFGCAGPRLGDRERRFLRDSDPFGFILFQRNCETPDQIRRLTDALRDTVGRRAPILIDQEGGRVQRLRGPYWHSAPAAAWFGALFERQPDRAVELAALNAHLIADDLYNVGVDVNCAPVLDLKEQDGHAVIGDRAFGSAPDSVVALGRAWIAGLTAGGVVPVIKHIPGHGRARVDSHDGLPVVDAALADLMARDFEPFRALNDAPAAMTGHLLFTAIDAAQPVTLSRQAIDRIIRGAIGFDGLLISDDVSMSALSGSIAERAVSAAAAGCDIVLHCNGDMVEMETLAERTPELCGAARRRAEAVTGLAGQLAAERGMLDRDRAVAALDAVVPA